MSIATPAKLSLEDFLKLPETKPASEYIEGEVIQKPMPQGKHSTLQGELVSVINTAVRSQRIAWAFPKLRCTFGGRSLVPDVAVFAWGRIPLDQQGDIANVFDTYPDWTIAIMPPEQRLTQITRNILHCLQHGAQLGWLIDPDERCVLVYFPGQRLELVDDPQAILPLPELISARSPGFQLTVNDLFGWLKPASV